MDQKPQNSPSQPTLTTAHPQKTSRLPVVSLVLAISGTVLPLAPLTGIPAIICALVARSRISKSKEVLKGKGIALAGLIVGLCSFVVFFLFWMLVVSFAVWFSPETRVSKAPVNISSVSSIGGDLVTLADYRNAAQEVETSYLLRFGTWPDKAQAQQLGFDLDRETLCRLVLIKNLMKLRIAPSDQVVAGAVVNLLRKTESASGGFASYEAFKGQILGPRGVSEADFERCMRHELGVSELMAIVTKGVGEAVTEAEAKAAYAKENESIVCQIARFSGSTMWKRFLAILRVWGSSTPVELLRTVCPTGFR